MSDRAREGRHCVHVGLYHYSAHACMHASHEHGSWENWMGELNNWKIKCDKKLRVINPELSISCQFFYSVSQNKVLPSEKKIFKILLIISELFFIYDINMYVVVYHQCKYHQVWPFNFRDMTKSVRVFKISLVPTYPIHHVHWIMWPYLLSPTIIKQIIILLLLVFIYDVNKYFCTQ